MSIDIGMLSSIGVSLVNAPADTEPPTPNLQIRTPACGYAACNQSPKRAGNAYSRLSCL